jgi:TolA-binding protein
MLALLAVAAALAVDGGSGQSAFEAAISLEGRGQYAEAAAALEKLARELPNDAFADDALFEAAQLFDERLSDPARARLLYDEVARRWPDGRLARRARTRADDLARGLTTGAAPLTEYEAILNGFAGRGKAESRTRMEALVRAHSDFAFADRAWFWLATQAVDDRRWDDAFTAIGEIERRFPSSDAAPRATKLRADLLLRTGHPFAAREIYRSLGGNATMRAAQQEGLKAVRRAIWRRAVSIAALVWLVGWCAWRIWRRRAAKTRGLPSEVAYLAGIAAIFCAAALTENGSIRGAVLMLAGGGVGVAWLAAGTPASRLATVFRLLAVVVSISAVAWLALQVNDLTDLIVETLSSGPER